MKPIHSTIFAALLVAAATTAGVYATAATTASTMAASFHTTESSSRLRIIEFEAAAWQAAVEHRMAHAKCKLFGGTEKAACLAKANRSFNPQ